MFGGTCQCLDPYRLRHCKVHRVSPFPKIPWDFRGEIPPWEPAGSNRPMVHAQKCTDEFKQPEDFECPVCSGMEFWPCGEYERRLHLSSSGEGSEIHHHQSLEAWPKVP